MKNKKLVLQTIVNVLFVQLGAFLAAVGLEEFLVPNRVLDGGVVGLSIMGSFLSGLPLGLFIFVLNLPFIALSFRQIGAKFVALAIYAIASLSLWVTFFAPVRELTHDLFLATIFGGMVLGIGVGIIIRNGGCTDGTEIVAIIMNKRLPFSVGEIVMFFNLFVFALAGLVFGVDRALYSIAAYLIAYKMIDLVVEGIDESKSLFIVSEKTDQISARIMESMGTGVTILRGMGGYSRQERDIVYLIVRRLEITRVKDLVRSIDDHAFITVQNVHEVIGKNVGRDHSVL